MDHLQATHPGLRHELRGYLVRYRHLQPLVVATMALAELETALGLLQLVSVHLPVVDGLGRDTDLGPHVPSGWTCHSFSPQSRKVLSQSHHAEGLGQDRYMLVFPGELQG